MIKGEKVDLVAVSAKFLADYHRWINDPEVTDLLGKPVFHISMENERKWVETVTSGGDRPFTILTKRGVPIGNLGLMKIDFNNRHAVLGIMIGEKDYWNKGYGTDAIKTLLRFAFEEMNLHRVTLYVDELNKRAIACYKGCGFVEEGRQREFRFHNGTRMDQLTMGILRGEWLRSRSSPSRRKK